MAKAGARRQRVSRRRGYSKKLLRKKKNESWAMRLVVAALSDRRNDPRSETAATWHTSPTLGVGGNLLCKIVQCGFGERTHPGFPFRHPVEKSQCPARCRTLHAGS